MPSVITTAHLLGCAPCACATQARVTRCHNLTQVPDREHQLAARCCLPAEQIRISTAPPGFRNSYTVLLLESCAKIRRGSKLLNQPHAPRSAASLQAMFIWYLFTTVTASHSVLHCVQQSYSRTHMHICVKPEQKLCPCNNAAYCVCQVQTVVHCKRLRTWLRLCCPRVKCQKHHISS